MKELAEFERYMAHLCAGLGHSDRHAGLRGHCTGLMAPLERRSVEPMAAHLASRSQAPGGPGSPRRGRRAASGRARAGPAHSEAADMKTDDLIDMLARGAGPAPRALALRRLSPVAVAGLLMSAGLALAWFGAIPPQMFETAVQWTKMVYAGALALAAGWWTSRLSRPAAPTRQAQRLTGLVVLGMAVLGAVSLASAPAGARLAALLGHSWATCPWNVLALSLPALAASLWAVRGLAPTRLRSAGFAAGTLAGSLGAFGYALSCPEASPAFRRVGVHVGHRVHGCARRDARASRAALVAPRSHAKPRVWGAEPQASCGWRASRTCEDSCPRTACRTQAPPQTPAWKPGVPSSSFGDTRCLRGIALAALSPRADARCCRHELI